MQTRDTRTVPSYFAVLCKIRSVKRSVSWTVLHSHSLCHWCCHVWTTRCNAILPSRSSVVKTVVGSKCTWHGRSLGHASMNTWLHFYMTCIGVVFRNASRLGSRYYCTVVSTDVHLDDELQRVADVESRQPLWSASTAAEVVPSTSHSTIGDRAFPVAATWVWNSLPQLVTSSPSPTIFRWRLKTEHCLSGHTDLTSNDLSCLFFWTLCFIVTIYVSVYSASALELHSC